MGALTVGVVQQPVLGEQHCGDAYCVIEREGYAVLAVADGLGHGREAEEAAQLAMKTIAAHPERPVRQLLEDCHQALRSTRGAVLSVVHIDLVARVLHHAGLGNIETRVVGAEKVRRPVSVNGIVGHQLRPLREETVPFLPGDLLIMHSDGLSDRFESTPASRDMDPQGLARRLALGYGKHHDDQLVLVAREEL